MQVFKDDFKTWPCVPYEKFYEMLFKTCKINFSENIGRIIDGLQKDLEPKVGSKMINIKKLRDLILGEKLNHNKVWLWGLEDERVGCHLESGDSRDKAKG
jgi:hypothetical protein